MSLKSIESNKSINYNPRNEKINLDDEKNLKVMAAYLNEFNEYAESEKIHEDFLKISKIIPINKIFRDHLISREDNIYTKNISNELNFFLYYIAYLYKKSPENFTKTLKELNIWEQDLIEVWYVGKDNKIEAKNENFIEFMKAYNKDNIIKNLWFLSMDLWFIQVKDEDINMMNAYRKDILQK